MSIDTDTPPPARSGFPSDIPDDDMLLDATTSAYRVLNAAHAAFLASAEQFYDSRIRGFDNDSVPRTLDPDRVAHTSAINQLAAATTTTAGTLESALNVWWASHPAYKELFIDGAVTLDVLRTIRDHTHGVPREVLAAIEPDIIAATAHFTLIRLGREIDRLITEHDPAWVTHARKRAASTTKKVRLTKLPRGMARMSAVLCAIDAAELTALVDAECDRICGLDPRTLDTRRSDAFTALARGGHLSCLCGYPRCLDEPDDDTDTESGTDTNTDSGTDPSSDGGDSGGGGSGTVKFGDEDEPDVAEPDDDGSGARAPYDSGPGGCRSGGVSAVPPPAGRCECGRPLPIVPDAIPCSRGATNKPATPLIHITADLETVLGLHNRSAYLHGYGPLDPDHIRELATDATWQIIFTASRKYLDTLTDFADYDPPPSDTSVEHVPHCTCACGEPPRPQPTTSHNPPTETRETLTDLLNRAATEHDHHASGLPNRMSTPTPEQCTDDRRRSTLSPPRTPHPPPQSALAVP
ncbi:DUF222 domain-containing protein [Rhodococcus sp. P1Y]|uniref:DUF222 domain-containing protein n=1 Tax=Rhodococcus sp. P1Y TaxID=1302308 RepID=UPI0012937735|nr:DUF222 domain-containing protein [Rhodococcus sp. P1Y]